MVRKVGIGCAIWLIAAQWAYGATQNESSELPQLDLRLPTGVYRCAYGEPLVGIDRSTETNGAVKVHYQGRVHELRREISKSGLPRFSDEAAGLLWIDLPWKSVLLNLRNERPIANDCTFAPELTLAQLDKGHAAERSPQEKRVKKVAKNH
ncbi:hypothetical protein [Hydrogenophilus thiooxidans]|uniref:hypothetical protein n=1 Tax=Hydrogenophilus thiooxidans TaxID=2820326 RepID=UPI001C227EBE|nr:hypothetical protein [Hydrogenophilus thiooxidans]